MWAVVALASGAAWSPSAPSGGDVPTSTVLREVRGPDGTITAIRFDYPSGIAYRTVVAARTGTVLSREHLPGRPQSSRAEFQRAVRVIRADGRLSRLVAPDAVPEGGFIVDGPPGSLERHRYIQVRLLTPDRSALLEVVLVDLTAGAVASARRSFG